MSVHDDDGYSRFEDGDVDDEQDDGRVVTSHPYSFQPANKFLNNDKMSKDDMLELARDMAHQATTLKPLDEPEIYKTPRYKVINPEVHEQFFAGKRIATIQKWRCDNFFAVYSKEGTRFVTIGRDLEKSQNQFRIYDFKDGQFN